MRRALFLLAATACTVGAHAQLILTNGEHVLEVGGFLSTYWNQRFLEDGQVDHKKDRFSLRDAQLELEGRYRNEFEYELHFDIADMSAGPEGVDPENPGLMDAHVTWKGIPHIDVGLGYGKLPYGRSNAVPFQYSPYWQQAEVTRGNVYSQRDIGLTLAGSFSRQRGLVQLGAYSGLGELSLGGNNDASGHLEYIGRVEMAWPSRYRKRDIDDRITPVPMFVVGANARYMDKTQPLGEALPPLVGGDYGLKVVDGKRTAIGADAAAQWKGFSAQFEIHRLRIEPHASSNPLFEGVPAEKNDGYVLAGGYYGQLNWFSRKWKTILSVRYEELNLNDLAPGDMQRISAAFAYQLRGFDAMFKVQYWHNIKEETPIDPLGWTDQLRAGFQYTFN